MSAELLHRELAPVVAEAWKLIDEEAKRVLELTLAGRRLVDFRGPLGWELGAVSTGAIAPVREGPVLEVSFGLREVARVVELHTSMRLSLASLDAVGRGARTADLEPVTRAAERLALAEDHAVFHGYGPAAMTGIIPASPHAHVTVRGAADYPRAIVNALELLRKGGVNGPYGVALGPAPYGELVAAHPEGCPIAKQIQQQILAGGPLVRAPALEGGVVLSLRGGDYELSVGHDFAVGYSQHRGDDVELFLTESFAFRVLEPMAAVVLAAAD